MIGIYEREMTVKLRGKYSFNIISLVTLSKKPKGIPNALYLLYIFIKYKFHNTFWLFLEFKIFF